MFHWIMACCLYGALSFFKPMITYPYGPFKIIFNRSSVKIQMFLAATKQLYEWYFPSVRLSVCPSHLFDYVPIIVSSWNFQKLSPRTRVRSMQKVKVRGQMSRSQRSRPNLTPVWIRIWWWNDTYSLMLLRRGALLFLKVIRQISRSHGSKIRRIWPRLGISGL